MSDIENVEELSLEDQKKALNLQDLVYIKKYIDDNHYSKEETDSMMSSMVDSEVDSTIAENTYNKSEIDANHYTKTEIDTNYYTKSQLDANYYTKTDADETFYNKAEMVNRASVAEKIIYTTVAPTTSPSEGTLVICLLSSLPTTRYDRVWYLIGG